MYCFLLMVLCSAGVIVPTSFVTVRADEICVLDEHGRRQWVPFEPKQCAACNGKKKVDCPCREKRAATCVRCETRRRHKCADCAGRGKTSDPFVSLRCDPCDGYGHVACVTCDSKGYYRFSGKSSTKSTCASCQGAGRLLCPSCNGQQRIRLQGSTDKLRKASKTKLLSLQNELQSASRLLRNVTERRGNSDVYIKNEYIPLLTKIGRVLPAAKDHAEGLRRFEKDLDKLSGFHFGFGDTRAIRRGELIEKCKAQINAALLRKEKIVQVGIDRIEFNESLDR